MVSPCSWLHTLTHPIRPVNKATKHYIWSALAADNSQLDKTFTPLCHAHSCCTLLLQLGLWVHTYVHQQGYRCPHTHTSCRLYTPSMEEAYTTLYNITSCIEPSDGEVYKRPFTTPMSPGKMADLHSLRSACGPQWDYHRINQGSAMSHNYALDDMLQW